MNYFKAFILAIISLTAQVSTAWATSDSSIQKLNSYDQWIFEETYKQCKSIGDSSFLIYFNKNNQKAFVISMGQSLSLIIPFAGLENDELQNYLKNNFISNYTHDKLSSTGYHMALKKCFGSNENLKNSFTKSLLAADTLGKAPAVFFGVYSVRRIFNILNTKYPKLTKYLSLGTLGAMAVTLAVEIRNTYLKSELKPEEQDRINQVNQNLDQEIKLNMIEVKTFVEETREKLLIEINNENDLNKKKEMIKALKDLDYALSVLGDS